ncbi:MAG: efflux RND transporter permease subunit [Candidatus Margulisbacteria bacterium]|nr:efflux RND transporter permease subunit [Candidatus Margulisiibacteriota bacterium]
MTQLLQFFLHRHFLVNTITVLVLLGGILAWNNTNKEELPDITFNTVRISTAYSGASAADIEWAITKPIEETLKGMDGIARITSTSSPGSSSISVELSPDVSDIDKMVTEIQSQVSRASLPNDLLNDPQVRVFETSKKAIIDIGIYFPNQPLLTTDTRKKLQSYARGLESTLLNQPELFEIRRQGVLQEEINIEANPSLFSKFDITLNSIGQEVQKNHIRAPSGTLKSGKFEQVTLLSELDTHETLNQLVIQGGFDSTPIALQQIASISDGFEDQRSIIKVNGREAILLNVVKNSGYGIIESLDVVKRVVTTYQNSHLTPNGIRAVFLDDESIDLRNRLSIIMSNGLIGFVLIALSLFVFLNKRSGIWVALGIPFTLASTLIGGYFLGYSINGITLSAIIIVLGIVVDDAIIVAENITRRMQQNEPLFDAALNGTKDVMAPILASILTTCAAFMPLLFFSGRMGQFVEFIPIVIFLMLISSLIESFFLLPSHITMLPAKPQKKAHWFASWETTYEGWLRAVLKKRYWVIIAFALTLFGSVFLAKNSFKFVMFPNEESRDIVLSGIVPNAQSAIETAMGIQPLEDFLAQLIGNEGVGFRSSIAQGRRGDSANENQFRISLELRPLDQRNRPSKAIIQDIQAHAKQLPGIANIKFRRQRYGQQSGSAIEIIVAENNDDNRDELSNRTINALSANPNLINIESDRIPFQNEYVIGFNQKELKRLAINPTDISSTLRAALNGRRLYSLLRNDEEVNVNLTVASGYTTSIENALTIPIANNRNYLVPLEDVVTVTPIQAKKSIRRQDHKRISYIYADLAPTANQSPLEIAATLERDTFPALVSQFPNAALSFDGEVVDTRASKSDLRMGIIAAIVFIYFVLALLFESLTKPFRIMVIIPFGIIGVILAFYMHQKFEFGFYSAIGTLGMLGVVVNDAIIMLNKLDTQTTHSPTTTDTANTAKTRLRAVLLTTFTTVAGVVPTAYGIGGTDTMLSDMMLSLAWGLLFGSLITLVLMPCIFQIEQDVRRITPKFKPKALATLTAIVMALIGAPAMANTPTLPLPEFIINATKNDTAFHRLLIDRLGIQYAMDAGVDSPELALAFTSNYAISSDSRTNIQGITLSQTLPALGNTFSVSLADDGQGSTSTFSFSQDIARNAFGANHRLDQRIQELKTALIEHQLVEAYEDYMAELIGLYYTWIRQKESLQFAQSAADDTRRVFQGILERQQKKIANDTDVNKLKLQLLSKQEQVIAFKQHYVETTEKIRRAIGAPLDTPIGPDPTIPMDPLPLKPNASFFSPDSPSRTIIMLTKLKQQLGLEVDRLSADILPSAALSATIIDGLDTYGTAGLSIRLPLQQPTTKAKLELARIKQKKNDQTMALSIDTLNTQLRVLYQALVQQHELIQIAQEKRDLAHNILQSETENYSYGKITLNDYLAAVNRFDSARFDEMDRKIGYQKLSLEWKRLTDQLVTKKLSEL